MTEQMKKIKKFNNKVRINYINICLKYSNNNYRLLLLNLHNNSCWYNHNKHILIKL